MFEVEILEVFGQTKVTSAESCFGAVLMLSPTS